MKILVTGGAGYLGSTTAKALEQAGHTPVILDSLLTGPRVFVKDRAFYEGDIADRELLRRVVADHPDIEATIHMAARIVVPENPLWAKDSRAAARIWPRVSGPPGRRPRPRAAAVTRSPALPRS